MLIYIDFSVLSAIRNYDLEGKDSHCVEICTQPDLKGLNVIYSTNSMEFGNVIGTDGKLFICRFRNCP